MCLFLYLQVVFLWHPKTYLPDVRSIHETLSECLRLRTAMAAVCNCLTKCKIIDEAILWCEYPRSLLLWCEVLSEKPNKIKQIFSLTLPLPRGSILRYFDGMFTLFSPAFVGLFFYTAFVNVASVEARPRGSASSNSLVYLFLYSMSYAVLFFQSA